MRVRMDRPAPILRTTVTSGERPIGVRLRDVIFQASTRSRFPHTPFIVWQTLRSTQITLLTVPRQRL